MSQDSSPVNHYDVLGVPQNASLQDIKAKYRELVRLHHPDATGGKEASNQQIVRINQAYKALSDPTVRAKLDDALRRESLVKERMARAQRAVEQRGVRSGAVSADPPISPERLLREAELALSRGSYRDAREICYRILKFDSRCAKAFALLGDLSHVRGNREDAIANYTMAAQLEPANPSLRGKLKRLMEESEVAVRRSIAVRGRPMLAIPQTPVARVSAAVLCAAALVSPFVFLGEPGPPMFPGVALISQWSERLLATLLGSSFLLGLGLSFTGLLRRIEDDLLVERSGRGAPLGIFLIIGGILFYFLSLVLYILSGLLQDNFSPSLNIVYALTTALVIVFAGACGAAALQVLLLGGNVIFVAMLFGWFLGDILHTPA